MNKSKVAIVVSHIIEKIEMILGGGWTIFCTLGLIVIITDDEEDGVGFVIFIICIILVGILVFLRGSKRKKMRLEFKKYVAHLSTDPTGSLENIATSTGTSVDVVKKNIQFMINKNFFYDAYIDENNNRLVLPSMKNNMNQTELKISVNNVTPGVQERIVYTTCNCPNCGGINQIAQGSVAECDFCGSNLQG